MSVLKKSIALVFLLGVVAFVPAFGDPTRTDKEKTDAGKVEKQKQDESEENVWMRLKLRSSQEILGGLTSGDLKKVEEQGRRLLAFNILEKWIQENPQSNKSEYQGQLHVFEYAAKEIVRNAESKNLDGALSSFILLTRSCVECHKLIRDVPAKP